MGMDTLAPLHFLYSFPVDIDVILVPNSRSYLDFAGNGKSENHLLGGISSSHKTPLTDFT